MGENTPTGIAIIPGNVAITPALISEFNPTDKQVAFLQAALNPKTPPSIEDWIEAASVSAIEFKGWKQDSAFLEWFLRELESGLALYKAEWLRIGIFKMKSDRETWKEMAKIFYPQGLVAPISDGSERNKLEQTVIGLFQRIKGQ